MILQVILNMLIAVFFYIRLEKQIMATKAEFKAAFDEYLARVDNVIADFQKLIDGQAPPEDFQDLLDELKTARTKIDAEDPTPEAAADSGEPTPGH